MKRLSSCVVNGSDAVEITLWEVRRFELAVAKAEKRLREDLARREKRLLRKEVSTGKPVTFSYDWCGTLTGLKAEVTVVVEIIVSAYWTRTDRGTLNGTRVSGGLIDSEKIRVIA